jgi:hypothetical protein
VKVLISEYDKLLTAFKNPRILVINFNFTFIDFLNYSDFLSAKPRVFVKEWKTLHINLYDLK